MNEGIMNGFDQVIRNVSNVFAEDIFEKHQKRILRKI